MLVRHSDMGADPLKIADHEVQACILCRFAKVRRESPHRPETSDTVINRDGMSLVGWFPSMVPIAAKLHVCIAQVNVDLLRGQYQQASIKPLK